MRRADGLAPFQKFFEGEMLSKKKWDEKAVQRGLEELRRLGAAIDERSPGLVKILQSHCGKGRETDLAIVFLLGRIADPSARELLASLEEAATERKLRKEIRRSLFKLEQKGIVAPPSETGRPVPAEPILRLGPEIEGYLSSVDGAGGRLVWLAKPQAGSGVQLLQGMVSDREGLIRVGGAVIRRKELRRMAQDIKEQHGISMISVPWEYGDQLLYEAFEKAKAMGRSGIEQFTSIRGLFTTAKPKPSDHPICSRLRRDEVRAGAWRELSRRLLEEPEFRPWVLDEDWMKPYLEEVESARESRLVLNPLQKEERVAGIVRDAVEELFSGEKGKIFQRRLEDMALYLLETNREDTAKLAFAIALQFAEGNSGRLDISFLSGLVQKSMGFYLSQSKAKQAEELSLIVKP